MLRHKSLIFALTVLSATAAISLAQNPTDQDNSQTNDVPTQAQPAPVERANTTPYVHNRTIAKLAVGQDVVTKGGTASTLAAPGVFLRVGDRSSVRAVALGEENTELRVESGIANISVHHPAKNAQILVDLPGGQTALTKDGLYTFNAGTNAVHVLKGEAFAYPGTDTNQKPIKIKEDHALIFNGPQVKPFEFDPMEARADLIPYPAHTGVPESSGYYGAYGGYPYYGYGYPSYWGYPYWGWDYPFGFGFYGGGFYDGGWRGGGWRGGGFHGGHGRR